MIGYEIPIGAASIKVTKDKRKVTKPSEKSPRQEKSHQDKRKVTTSETVV